MGPVISFEILPGEAREGHRHVDLMIVLKKRGLREGVPVDLSAYPRDRSSVLQ